MEAEAEAGVGTVKSETGVRAGTESIIGEDIWFWFCWTDTSGTAFFAAFLAAKVAFLLVLASAFFLSANSFFLAFFSSIARALSNHKKEIKENKPK